MNGKLIGVGVGPGDPELMTLKAVKAIQDNEVIAVPGKDVKSSHAYKIASGAYPEIEQKTLLALEMPMTKDKDELAKYHDIASETVMKVLKTGQNVVFLTLGDVSIYSTYWYLQERVSKQGYQTEMISGVPSFCAAAAALNIPLTSWEEPLHVFPAAHNLETKLCDNGNYVYMKAGKALSDIKKECKGQNSLYMVENCGMEHEKLYLSAKNMPEEASYLSIVIAK